ncbi:hypothetical protein ACRJ4B_22555 [Streptomyces sp. GTA36]
MRTPHPIAAHSHSPPNPYEDLAALDDGPLEDFLQVEEPAVAEGAERGGGVGTAQPPPGFPGLRGPPPPSHP